MSQKKKKKLKEAKKKIGEHVLGLPLEVHQVLV